MGGPPPRLPEMGDPAAARRMRAEPLREEDARRRRDESAPPPGRGSAEEGLAETLVRLLRREDRAPAGLLGHEDGIEQSGARGAKGDDGAQGPDRWSSGGPTSQWAGIPGTQKVEVSDGGGHGHAVDRSAAVGSAKVCRSWSDSLLETKPRSFLCGLEDWE